MARPVPLRAEAVPEPLDVGRLRLLLEVARRGTIAAAARALGLTASAVSQQLAVLEREAGTSLLDRGPRGVTLTGAGTALTQRAEQIVQVLDHARSDLDRLHGGVGGRVRVATVASAAATIVSDAVLALRESHPDVVVDVVAAEPADSIALVQDDDADVALVDEYDYRPVALPEFLTGLDLHREPLVVVAPPGLLSRRSVRLTTLAEHDWVMPPAAAACGSAVRSACREAGFEPRVRWETDDMLLLVRTVAAGHGITVLPRLAVSSDVAAVDVRRLVEPELHRRLIAASRHSAASRPAVQATLAALAAAAKG